MPVKAAPTLVVGGALSIAVAPATALLAMLLLHLPLLLRGIEQSATLVPPSSSSGVFSTASVLILGAPHVVMRLVRLASSRHYARTWALIIITTKASSTVLFIHLPHIAVLLLFHHEDVAIVVG